MGGGQRLDLASIARAGRAQGCTVGFDLAHSIGNVEVALHDSGADFAVWCHYKYVNAGPGAVGGAYVHERHGNRRDLPRFAGWWGHDKTTRFLMGPQFEPIEGAEGWQLSNPPILAMAPLMASLEHFDEVGMPALRRKSVALTGYLEALVGEMLGPRITIVTPADPEARGAALSLRVHVDRDRACFPIHRQDVDPGFAVPTVGDHDSPAGGVEREPMRKVPGSQRDPRHLARAGRVGDVEHHDRVRGGDRLDPEVPEDDRHGTAAAVEAVHELGVRRARGEARDPVEAAGKGGDQDGPSVGQHTRLARLFVPAARPRRQFDRRHDREVREPPHLDSPGAAPPTAPEPHVLAHVIGGDHDPVQIGDDREAVGAQECAGRPWVGRAPGADHLTGVGQLDQPAGVRVLFAVPLEGREDVAGREPLVAVGIAEPGGSGERSEEPRRLGGRQVEPERLAGHEPVGEEVAAPGHPVLGVVRPGPRAAGRNRCDHPAIAGTRRVGVQDGQEVGVGPVGVAGPDEQVPGGLCRRLGVGGVDPDRCVTRAPVAVAGAQRERGPGHQEKCGAEHAGVR